jgi:TRAP-type C4-dicarboxylate transport system permease large subunit
MFPGMITGLSTAAVLPTGALAAPALILLGIPHITVAAMVAMSAIYGMIAPPINIPAMIIGGGVDMPYIGFELPLIFATFPLAFGVNIMLGYKHIRNILPSKVVPVYVIFVSAQELPIPSINGLILKYIFIIHQVKNWPEMKPEISIVHTLVKLTGQLLNA